MSDDFKFSVKLPGKPWKTVSTADELTEEERKIAQLIVEPSFMWPPVMGAQKITEEVRDLVHWANNTMEQLRNANGCLVQFTSRCELLDEYVRKLLEEQQTQNYLPELRQSTTWAAERVDRTLRETIDHLKQVRTEYTPLLGALPLAADDAEQDFVLGRFLIDEEDS